MIKLQTHLNVADNSGARELMCIRIIGASNHRYAHIGDVIIAVIKEAVSNMPLERSEVVTTQNPNHDRDGASHEDKASQFN